MPGLALALGLVYAFLTFGVRVWLQVRRTGSTGVAGVSGRVGSVEWIGGALFVASLLALFGAPVLDLAGAVAPIDALDGTAGHVAGTVLAVAGIGATFYAQLAMGSSWRVGVDESERTALVTGGPFALVRNPIYSGMLPTLAGIVLLTPSVVALAGYAGLFVALEVQTRLVEEPYLLRVHGDAYAGYARRVGRFVPGLGRIGR